MSARDIVYSQQVWQQHSDPVTDMREMTGSCLLSITIQLYPSVTLIVQTKVDRTLCGIPLDMENDDSAVVA